MRRGTATVMAALGAAAALILTLSPPAQAAPAAAGCVPEVEVDTEAGAGAVLALVDELRADGADRAEIDRQLADRACMTRVTTAATQSAGGLTVTAPNVYKMAVVNGKQRWVAMTEWSFKTVPTAPMNGEQGVATWFDAPVRPVLQVVHYRGFTDAFPNTSRENAADLDPYGVGFLITPQKTATDMNMAIGSTALVFEGTPGCRTLTARGSFAHTWNSTDVYGIDVHSAGVTYHWSATNDRAESVSQPTVVPNVCG